MLHPMIINANAQSRYDEMLKTAENYRLAQKLNTGRNTPRLQLFANLSNLLKNRRLHKNTTVTA